MRLINILIVEDEDLVAAHITTILDKSFGNQLSIKYADNIEDGINVLLHNAIDIVLLDLQVGNRNGIEILQFFEKPTFKTIVITAYTENMVNFFEYGIVAYILKPIETIKLVKAINKITTSINTAATIATTSILLPVTNSQKLAINVTDIIYIQANGRYVQITLANIKEPVTITKNIGEVEKTLPTNMFIRVHNAYIVNKNYVAMVNKDNTLTLIAGTTSIPVSVRKRKTIMAFFGSL